MGSLPLLLGSSIFIHGVFPPCGIDEGEDLRIGGVDANGRHN